MVHKVKKCDVLVTLYDGAYFMFRVIRNIRDSGEDIPKIQKAAEAMEYNIISMVQLAPDQTHYRDTSATLKPRYSVWIDKDDYPTHFYLDSVDVWDIEAF